MATARKFSEEDLRRMSQDELLHQFRQMEGNYLKVVADRGTMMKDMNHRMQVHLLEIRSLKDVNQKLQDDNQELRDLCCFLDDDRQKGRKLAREWQRFGRYTSSVMRSEVAAYQAKLKELEIQQETLMKENMELKELCLFLDGERGSLEPEGGSSGARAEGDGSSSSSPSAEKLLPDDQGLGFEVHDTHTQLALPEPYRPQQANQQQQPNQQLEAHKTSLTLHLQNDSTIRSQSEGNAGGPRKFFSTPQLNNPPPIARRTNMTTMSTGNLRQLERTTSPLGAQGPVSPPTSPPPDRVMQAMKVLEVYEQLEKPAYPDSNTQPGNPEVDEAQKAIVREMCNVVWRKLGDAVPGYKTPV